MKQVVFAVFLLAMASLTGCLREDETNNTVECELVPYGHCSGEDLSGQDLSELNLTGIDLSYANLTGAMLHYADFTDAIVTDSDFTDTYWYYTIWTDGVAYDENQA